MLLLKFSSAHPMLERTRFIGDWRLYCSENSHPLVSAFADDSPRLQLTSFFTITRITLGRTIHPSIEPSFKWHIIELTLVTKASLIDIVSLVSTSFPAIHALTLAFEGPPLEYHIVYNFHFGTKKPWRSSFPRKAAYYRAISRTVWCANRIAEHAPRIERFDINERGRSDEDRCCGWSLGGWLEVVETSSGRRRVRGTL
ncbi:hypothetical protein GYMLUDRAFT_240433 [Collybiopsis luxurians FD-317 M1]|nr:hypothetical protein GYMLUDRAFT_240433 [Collybiopsis luxurians FD-317 M1]